MTQRQPRQRDPSFLAFLRLQPCCTCGNDRSEAAHIRSGSLEYGKRATGMAEKPDDCWALPQCRSCHRMQHSLNELQYWKHHGIDPFALAMKYYAQGGGKTTTKKPRNRTAIKSRGFGRSRKLQSRSSF